MTNVYLVLKHRSESDSIEIQGIFSTEGAALAACRTAEDTVTILTLDHEYPQELTNDSTILCPVQNLVWLPGASEWTPATQST